MKRQLSILLAAALLIGLASCGKEKEKDPTAQGTWNVQKATNTVNDSRYDEVSTESIDLTSEEAKAQQSSLTLEIGESVCTVTRSWLNEDGEVMSYNYAVSYELDGMTGSITLPQGMNPLVRTCDLTVSKLTANELVFTIDTGVRHIDLTAPQTSEGSIKYTYRQTITVEAIR